MADAKGPETPAGAEYMFSRSFKDSARLHLQHWIWKEHLGYLLHPTIPSAAADLRVADVGTGNGCWLLDLAQHVSSNWTLEGFDVSAKQYPPKENIPTNVSFHVQNAFDEVPEHLRAKFDIVHIRAFAAVVKNGNPDPLLYHLVGMLKPGGYLQWDEFAADTFSAHAPSPSVSKENTEKLLELRSSTAKKLSLDASWADKGAMEANFRNRGLSLLSDVDKDFFANPDDLKSLLRKPYTDNWMMALEEVCFLMIARGGAPGAQINAKDLTSLLNNTAAEIEQGVRLWISLQVVVGQKPATQ